MDLEKLKKLFDDNDDSDDDKLTFFDEDEEDNEINDTFFRNKIGSKKDLFSKKFIDNKEDILKQKQILEQQKQEKLKLEHQAQKESNKTTCETQQVVINKNQTIKQEETKLNNLEQQKQEFNNEPISVNKTEKIEKTEFVPKKQTFNFSYDNSLFQIVESLLYIVGKEGISISNIAKLTDLSNNKIKSIIEELAIQKEQDAYSGLCIINEANTYKMVTKKATANIINNLVNQKFQIKKRRMNRACLEVLSIIAYNQPCTKKTIDTIRKKDSTSILKSLIANELVVVKNSNNMNLYSVTKKFLETFNLKSLSDLPKPKKTIDLDNIVE